MGLVVLRMCCRCWNLLAAGPRGKRRGRGVGLVVLRKCCHNLISCMDEATHLRHNHTHSKCLPPSSRPCCQQIPTVEADGSTWERSKVTCDGEHAHSCHRYARVHDYWLTMPRSTGSNITLFNADSPSVRPQA